MDKNFWKNKNTTLLIRAGVYKLRDVFGGDLTLNELVVIAYIIACIRYDEEIFLSDAVSVLEMPKSSIANTLNKLANRGVCECTTDPDDGRKKIYQMTETYRVILSEHVEELSEMARDFITSNHKQNPSGSKRFSRRSDDDIYLSTRFRIE
tara:strand:- start:801 stop:1253 length:453 start_codon:yes stop_codon:yes gene_type:complete